MAKRNELADVDYERIIHKTELAVLFLIDGKEVWLPKSRIEIDEEQKLVTIPQDFALEKGLI